MDDGAAVIRTPRPRAAGITYAAVAIADAVLAGSSGRRARRARRVTKPMLMPLLAAGTRAATAGRTDRLARGTTAAQALSWGGDIALLGQGERAFLTGVGSFAAAHVGYVAGFASVREPGSGMADPGPRVAAVAWLVLAPVMAAAAGRQAPELRVPVALYAGVLTTMFGASTTVRRSLPRGARQRIVAGTSLFLLSDALIGVQRFLREWPSPPLETAVMLTYTAGQWLIADGVARVGEGDV